MQNNYVSRDKLGIYARDDGSGPGPALMGADTLIGNDVYNPDGESLGDIKELMIDMASGQVAYAVMSFGGFMGMGDKLFAVPWAALKLDTAHKRFTLGVPKTVLKDAPGFDKAHWPSMADKDWAGSVHQFYGTGHGS
jgi:sporulation protein YlmC with PRC-barrel domain